MTSKDGKTIAPALVRLVPNFQGKIKEIIFDIYSDFHAEFFGKFSLNKTEKFSTLEYDAVSLKKQVAKQKKNR